MKLDSLYVKYHIHGDIFPKQYAHIWINIFSNVS